jgi:putative endonuclease
MRLGEWGERRALSYLQGQGYRLLAQNVHIEHCELDLVMEDRDMIVFVEVKTRTSSTFGAPEDSISSRKRSRLQKAAWGFLEQNDKLHSPWRIDVIAIEASKNRALIRLDHYPGAFDVGLM